MEYVLCDLCGGKDNEEIVRQTDVLHPTTRKKFSMFPCKALDVIFINQEQTPEPLQIFKMRPPGNDYRTGSTRRGRTYGTSLWPRIGSKHRTICNGELTTAVSMELSVIFNLD